MTADPIQESDPDRKAEPPLTLWIPAGVLFLAGLALIPAGLFGLSMAMGGSFMGASAGSGAWVVVALMGVAIAAFWGTGRALLAGRLWAWIVAMGAAAVAFGLAALTVITRDASELWVLGATFAFVALACLLAPRSRAAVKR